jgi:ribosome-binding ATPase
MKIGIIGLPGSGKTTLWNLLTETYDPAETAAFTGNKPRMKTVKVRDARLEKLRDDYRPKKYIPAQVEIYDFPAARKEGIDRSGIADLLAPARNVEALIVVLRGFEDVTGAPPHPLDDLAQISGELIISDLVIVENRLEKLEAQLKKHIAKTFDEDRKEKELLLRVKADLEAEKPLSGFPFTAEERKKLTSFQFLSAKPRLVVLNRGESPPAPEVVAKVRDAAGAEPIPIAARNELEVLQLPEEERAPFLEEFGIEELARDKVIAASYRVAGLQSFFTVGPDEVRAWTIRTGESALEAAGEIHSDIQRGFIRAEVVGYEDYIRDGGHKGAKEKGHYRLEGKEYLVRDGDIIEFRHGA